MVHFFLKIYGDYMTFTSKAHMVRALLNGKRYVDRFGIEMFYDEEYANPFRYGEDVMNNLWESYCTDRWTEVIPRHVHQDLIDSYQDGQVWQFKSKDRTDWDNVPVTKPQWDINFDYRLHPHNDLIQAHRSGAKIQLQTFQGDWADIDNPNWDEGVRYRIKPATKTVYEWMFIPFGGEKFHVEHVLRTEEDASRAFSGRVYRKTGRSWEVDA